MARLGSITKGRAHGDSRPSIGRCRLCETRIYLVRDADSLRRKLAFCQVCVESYGIAHPKTGQLIIQDPEGTIVCRFCSTVIPVQYILEGNKLARTLCDTCKANRYSSDFLPNLVGGYPKDAKSGVDKCRDCGALYGLAPDGRSWGTILYLSKEPGYEGLCIDLYSFGCETYHKARDARINKGALIAKG